MAISYYITSRRDLSDAASQASLTEIVRTAFRAGVDYVQIREKDLTGRSLAALVEQLASLPEKSRSRLLVNERLDVARSCGADGAHLPADSLPLRAVRSWAHEWTLGASCHNEQEAERAAAAGTDYVLVGPVFPTPSKPGAAGLGLAGLAVICKLVAIPVFALGGIARDNAAECIAAGARGVAGIRLFQREDRLDSLCEYLRSL